MIEVTNAQYYKDYKIRLEFNDGNSGIADLADDLWGQIFEPLRDLNKFKKFKVSKIMNTLVWENGADLAPEFLYEKIT